MSANQWGPSAALQLCIASPAGQCPRAANQTQVPCTWQTCPAASSAPHDWQRLAAAPPQLLQQPSPARRADCCDVRPRYTPTAAGRGPEHSTRPPICTTAAQNRCIRAESHAQQYKNCTQCVSSMQHLYLTHRQRTCASLHVASAGSKHKMKPRRGKSLQSWNSSWNTHAYRLCAACLHHTCPEAGSLHRVVHALDRE